MNGGLPLFFTVIEFEFMVWYGSIGFYDSELQIQRKSDNSILANHNSQYIFLLQSGRFNISPVQVFSGRYFFAEFRSLDK